MDSTRGQLLIAGPGLLDANFFRTVVLVIAHSDEGALGLVLNRPSETTVGEAVSELDDLLEADGSVYVGGPVQPSALIVLAEFDEAEQAALIAFEDIGVLASGAAEDGPPAVRRGRAFVGHAGWGPGQPTMSSSAATGSSSRRCARTPSQALPTSSGRRS